MTLKTKIAIEALKTAYTVGGLPAPVRNESRLIGFQPTGTPGYRWKLALVDYDWDPTNTELGDDGPGYELSIKVGVFLAVEGEAGDARDALFDAAVEVISGCLPPNTTLGGTVESVEIIGSVSREHYVLANGAPVEVLEFTVGLNLTAPTKFG